jgi:hypothetical protein
MGYLHSVSLWYNYIFSLANNSSFTLLPMQHSYAKHIANSRKEHNIVGPNRNSHFLNKELEVGRTNTLYGWLSVHRGRSGCAWKIVPPSVFDPPDHPAPRGSPYRLRYHKRHSYIYFKIVYNLCSHKIPNSYYSTPTAVKLVVDQSSSRQRRTFVPSLLGHHNSVPSRVLLFGGAWSYFISCVIGNKKGLLFHNMPNFKLNHPTAIIWFNTNKDFKKI